MFALHLNKTREYLPVSQNRSVVTIKAPTKKKTKFNFFIRLKHKTLR